MAHPMKSSAAEQHTDKLRRYTDHYGSAAGPSENIPAPTNRLKGEGPEGAIGFGADETVPSKARGDRPSRGSRRTTAANPVATYAKGGRVKGKGATHVNVIVSPQAGAPMPMPPPVVPVGGPPMPPMAPPMPPRPPMGGPPGLPMAPGAPGGMPPGIMPPRAKGGRVDAAEDKSPITKTLRDEGLTRERARGGRAEFTAGSLSGEGRLQKIAAYGKRAHMKPQAV